MRKLAILLLPAILGCSVLVPAGPVLDCTRDVDPCPSQEDLDTYVAAFAGWVAGFDQTRPLLVHVVDKATTWELKEPTGLVKAAGETISPNEMRINSSRVLGHELMHVEFWRQFGDGDANHALPPGPWTDFTDDSIRAFGAAVQMDW